MKMEELKEQVTEQVSQAHDAAFILHKLGYLMTDEYSQLVDLINKAQQRLDNER